MAKIPTYESRRAPSGRIARPNLQDYSVEIAQKLVRASNKVLDAKAIDEGFKAGKEEQAKSLEETNTLVQQEGYTLRSDAFNKGANAAYVSGMKSKADKEINQVATEINDPMSQIPIGERLSTYNEKVEEIRNNYLTDVPSHLQGDLAGYFDSVNSRYSSSVFNNEQNLKVNEMKATISSRVDTALENIPALIRDFGYDNNATLEEQFADLVASIDEGLQFISPSTAEAYKEKIRTIMQISAIEYAYNQAEDKQAFIDDIEQGGDIYKSIMADVNETYFDGTDQLELPQNGEGGYRTLSKRLQSLFDGEVSGMATDRAMWEMDATKALNLYKAGINPNYTFDAEQMKALGFSDVAILKYQEQFKVAEQVYPDIIAARTTAPNDNTTNLKALQKEFFELQNKEDLTADDRDRLIILSAQIDGVSTVLNNQKKAIADGDANLILDQAGITYDTTTVEGIQDYHNKIINQFGISEDLIKLVPQSQLDQDAEIFATGDWGQVMGLKQKYGKYFERFIRDAGLIQNGYQTVAIFSHPEVNQNYSEQIFNAIQDVEKNIKTAKNISSDFDGEGGALESFETDFRATYEEFLIGNADMADDVMNAARAMFVATYIRTGDTQKATDSILKNFGTAYNTFEHNGMKVLLPVTVNSDTIKNNIDDFIKHPQKYGIHTGSLFDINDFKEDFEDNTFDNYALAYDGGAVKIVNKENAMGVVTIFKRLPSGDGEIVYTNNINISENDNNNNVEHLETKDTVSIWEYDDVKFDEQINLTIETEESQQIGSAEEIADYDNQIAEIQKEIDELTAKSKVPEMLETILRPLKDKIAMLESEKLEISGNVVLTTEKKVEELLFAYNGLENKPVDYYAGTISSDKGEQDILLALSLYIKNGTMNEWVIETLMQMESFKGLENDAIASEVLANWSNNMNRTTKTKPPTRMTPIQALYDFVRDLEEANVTATSTNNNNEKMTFGQVLMGLD